MLSLGIFPVVLISRRSHKTSVGLMTEFKIMAMDVVEKLYQSSSPGIFHCIWLIHSCH